MANPGTHTGSHTGSPSIDPGTHDAYWRENFRNESYYDRNYEWDDYEPAYRYGRESYSMHTGRRYSDVERVLESGWERAKGKSRLMWQNAKEAVRAGWHRIERAMPGDADRD
ncbi:MAG TPA: hypothetical protein VJ011_05210 [Steroidobacteraceae bacterium]|nr:hypothetical protein [Steroidobacteraceae bacterium]